MTLDALVPSLDLCQQLKAAGLPQDTAFVWVKAPQGFISGGGWNMDKDGIHQIPDTPSKGYVDQVMLKSEVNTLHTVVCGAPVAEEILRELPETITVDGDTMTLDVFGDSDTWMVGWYKYKRLPWRLKDWLKEEHGEQPGIVMHPLVQVAAAAYLWWKK